METQIGKMSRALNSIENQSPVYHFEYLSIHNQRIALVRRIDVWHQITLPASMLVFGFFVNSEITRSNWMALVFGAFSASLIVWFVHAYARSMDQAVVRLYPRIVTLELLLDYRFYRDYLKNIKSKEVVSSEKRFVERCEALQVETAAQLSDEVSKLFNPADFPRRRRRQLSLDVAACFLVIGYGVIVVYMLWHL